jgi:hypothetical protein
MIERFFRSLKEVCTWQKNISLFFEAKRQYARPTSGSEKVLAKNRGGDIMPAAAGRYLFPNGGSGLGMLNVL